MNIPLIELVNALQPIEERRLLIMEEEVEEAFVAKSKGKNKSPGIKTTCEKKTNQNKEYKERNYVEKKWKEFHLACPNCKKKNHIEILLVQTWNTMQILLQIWPQGNNV